MNVVVKIENEQNEENTERFEVYTSILKKEVNDNCVAPASLSNTVKCRSSDDNITVKNDESKQQQQMVQPAARQAKT